MPPLNLTQQAAPAAASVSRVSGDLADYGGDLYYTSGTTSPPFPALVYTDLTANQLVTVRPQRILDTRTSAARTHITNAVGNLDSAGRLIGGHTINVDLSSLAVAAAAAACNLTAVSPRAAGFMTLWPGGTRPATSSINFAAAQVIANFAVTGITVTATNDLVAIFSSATTHMLLDITGFFVGNPTQVNRARQVSSWPCGRRQASSPAGTHLAECRESSSATDRHRSQRCFGSKIVRYSTAASR